MSRNVLAILLGFVALQGGAFDPAPIGFAAETSPSAEEFFENEIRPLLVARCFKCHGEGKAQGGLKLTSRNSVMTGGENGAAAVPGKPDESRLIRAIRYDDVDLQMPPDGKL